MRKSNKRKKYLVTVDGSEAFACSLVTNPAVEELFVSFSEEKPLIEQFADESKHMLCGVVAIPNKPIYRRSKDGEEYDIVFSAEAIEKMAVDYMRKYRQESVTLQHQEEANGVYLVEQWIKQDNYRDKSCVIGLSEDLPVGSWIQTYYVDSNDVWQRVQSGELRGFSLECALGLQEFESQINDKNNTDMIETNDMKFWSKMKEVLGEVFASVSMAKQDIEPIEQTDLEEQTPQEPQETPQESVETPKVEDTPSEPQNEAVEPQPTVEKPQEETPTEETPKDNHLEELINSLKEEIAALKKMNSGLDKKVKELSKMPSADPVNVNARPNASSTYEAWRQQMAQYL